jgi:hypothetical protein
MKQMILLLCIDLFKALSDISNGDTDAKVREIETLDFEGSNQEQLLCKIQQDLRELQNVMQYHRNLRGKIYDLNNSIVI